MRSLTPVDETRLLCVDRQENALGYDRYATNVSEFQRVYRSRFQSSSAWPVKNLSFEFKDNGIFFCSFSCDASVEGYTGIVQGGIIAAIIDDSMMQCLMGYGILAVTADIAVRYRFPVKLDLGIRMQTKLVESKFHKLYVLETSLFQEQIPCVTAKAKFFRVKREPAG